MFSQLSFATTMFTTNTSSSGRVTTSLLSKVNKQLHIMRHVFNNNSTVVISCKLNMLIVRLQCNCRKYTSMDTMQRSINLQSNLETIILSPSKILVQFLRFPNILYSYRMIVNVLGGLIYPAHSIRNRNISITINKATKTFNKRNAS